MLCAQPGSSSLGLGRWQLKHDPCVHAVWPGSLGPSWELRRTSSREHSRKASVVAHVYNSEVEARGLSRIPGQPGLSSVRHCGEFLMLSFHQFAGVCVASFEELFWLIYGNYMWACLFVSCVCLGMYL